MMGLVVVDRNSEEGSGVKIHPLSDLEAVLNSFYISVSKLTGSER